MKEGMERIVLALERIADILDKLLPSTSVTYQQGAPWGAKGTTDTPKVEGYSTKAEWNDYTKTGLSSADSREGDNLTPYKPVDFMHFSTGWSTSELKSAFSEIGKTIKIFDNACEDDECQK